MKEKVFLILTGGEISSKQLTLFLQKIQTPYIICVDGALPFALEYGCPIDFLVGDFDTVSKECMEAFREQVEEGIYKTQILSFCPEKDETDTQIAIELAMKQGATGIYVFGGIGSRMDHSIGNIHLMYKPMKQGISCMLIDEHNRLYLRDHSFVVNRRNAFGVYISFIPFGTDVKGVTLSGFKYNTDSVDFCMGSSLGISNELVEEQGNVSFEKGCFLVIESDD